MAVFLLQSAVGLLGTGAIDPAVPGRTYYRVSLMKVATSPRTHIETCGKVVYVRKQRDGDWHITLAKGRVKVVVEIIPMIPLPVPHKGQTIQVRGISRYDRFHRWAEIHPAESIQVGCDKGWVIP